MLANHVPAFEALLKHSEVSDPKEMAELLERFEAQVDIINLSIR